MSDFHFIEPEVAGDFGERTVLDYSTRPPTVLQLDFEFTVWLGDDLLASYPCFIATERLCSALLLDGGTGFHFEEMQVSRADSFNELYPGRVLPIFYWMKVNGVPGADDAGLTARQRLVVSDRFLGVLRGFNMDHCLVRRRPFRSGDKRG